MARYSSSIKRTIFFCIAYQWGNSFKIIYLGLLQIIKTQEAQKVLCMYLDYHFIAKFWGADSMSQEVTAETKLI